MSLDWQTIYLLEVDFPSGTYKQKDTPTFPHDIDEQHIWNTTEATKIRLIAQKPPFVDVEIDIPKDCSPVYFRRTQIPMNVMKVSPPTPAQTLQLFFWVGYALGHTRYFKVINGRTGQIIERQDKAWPQ